MEDTTALNLSAFPNTLAWADYDNDGDQDLLVSGQTLSAKLNPVVIDESANLGGDESRRVRMRVVDEDIVVFRDHD